MNRWKLLSPDHLASLMRFLCTREYHCVAFTERLLTEGHAVMPRTPDVNVAIRLNNSGDIDGAILQTRSGLYYPVLGDVQPTVESKAMDILRKKSRRIYSVMGRTQDVKALEAALPRHPEEAIEYHLMVQDTPVPEISLPRLPEGLSIERSRPADASLLANLQRQYEIEEVLLPGNAFDPVGSQRHLKSVLRSQIVLHGVVNGTPVAKAGTNARGAFYDQIGGVFTEREFRSRGVATALMLRLLSLIAAESKSATLFVKMDNGPALTMYQNLGFRVLDGFRISYYR